MVMTNGFQKGLTTLEREAQIDRLPIEGRIPGWLSGSLFRNGPGQFEVGQRPFRHWFDGSAMLHRFTFQDGEVSYANRYLQAPGYEGNKEAGEISYREFATDPCRNIFQRLATMFSIPGSHNANVNLTRLGEQFLAMTETPLPVAFDAETLETVGVVHYADDIGFAGTTAHPHFDPARNAAVNHLVEYGRQTNYSFIFIPNESPLRRQVISRTKVGKPAYIHSFGMTDNYLILAEFPYLVNPLRLLLSGKPFIDNFRWMPEQGTRFFVINKESGQVERVQTGDACFSFHHINAFEDSGDIVVDISAYDDNSIVQELFLDRLRGDYGGRLSFPSFCRFRLPADGRQAEKELLSESAIELPRINHRFNGRPYQNAYGVSMRPETRDDFFNALVKMDLVSRESTFWYSDGCYPGEPVFAAAPEGENEDDGVILSVVFDSKQMTSFVLLLDAASFTELARATVHHHVPLGFHGQYFDGVYPRA
jgi:carotenoid cleavage dioxygenase-like enzyme